MRVFQNTASQTCRLRTTEFDAIVTDQVLEHVAEGPFLAMQESFRVVKRGGLVVHATVFSYPIHGCPNDYWRFTPQALDALVKPYGRVIESGGWGNGWISLLWALGLRWEPMPTAKWHPRQPDRYQERRRSTDRRLGNRSKGIDFRRRH